MKILALLTDGYGGYGGIAQHARNILDSLADLDNTETIDVVPRLSPVKTFSHSDKIRINLSATRNDYFYIFQIVKSAFRKPRADLVICTHINLLPFAVFAKWITGGKLILILHGVEAWTKPSRPFIDRFLKYVDRSVPVSRFTEKRFIQWSGFPVGQSTVIPCAIDLKLFYPKPRPEYLAQRHGIGNEKILLTVGRLSSAEKAKGFDEIIQVMPALLKDSAEVRYLIVGDGDDMERLKSEAKKYKVDKHIIFTGQIPEEEKCDYYNLADAYVMPSRAEGFGIVFLEALACGLPVIGSKLDASSDTLQNGNLGILVNPDNPSELLAAILQSLKLGKNISPQIEDFSMEQSGLKFQRLVSDVLKNS